MQPIDLVPEQVLAADVLFVSHSGGKDSQATLAFINRIGLTEAKRIVVIHSDLGEMEWEPMHHWIGENSFGLPVEVVKADMDFFQLARTYGRLPSGNIQFCTDFLKTQPIEAFIHAYMYTHGYKTAINVTGMRAEESTRRSKKKPFARSEMTRPKLHPEHKIFDWLPIFGYSESEVFEEIALAGQKPHALYSQGFSRLSCVFCVNGRINEHRQAAKLRPELFQKVVALEKELGRTYRLQQRKGVKYPRYMDSYCN